MTLDECARKVTAYCSQYGLGSNHRPLIDEFIKNEVVSIAVDNKQLEGEAGIELSSGVQEYSLPSDYLDWHAGYWGSKEIAIVTKARAKINDFSKFSSPVGYIYMNKLGLVPIPSETDPQGSPSVSLDYWRYPSTIVDGNSLVDTGGLVWDNYLIAMVVVAVGLVILKSSDLVAIGEKLVNRAEKSIGGAKATRKRRSVGGMWI